MSDARYELRWEIIQAVTDAASDHYRRTGRYEVPRELVTAAMVAGLRGTSYRISAANVLETARKQVKRRFGRGRLPAIT